MTAIGSVITTLLGAVFLPHEDLWEVYDGIWGFNGVLAMGGVSCVFYAFGPMSFLLGIVDCVAVAIAHFALRANMALQVSKTAANVTYRKSSTCHNPIPIAYYS